MWEDYRQQYGLKGRVISISRAVKELPEKVKRYRLVLIDESHNLRNREGKRFRVIRDYIERNESKVILLSATPYNESYLDLASQLRLFLAEDRDIGIRQEALLREIGENEFRAPLSVRGESLWRVREKRVCRRLARIDAALRCTPHAVLYSETTTQRPTRKLVENASTLPRWIAFLSFRPGVHPHRSSSRSTTRMRLIKYAQVPLFRSDRRRY